MEIRVRSTGEIIFQDEFRRRNSNSMGAAYGELTEQILNDHGCDVVFEGPHATGGTHYQYSMRQGVEQLSDGKWYTKYVLGPIFTDTSADGNQPARTAAENEALYQANKDSQQATLIRAERNRKLADCDWTQLADSPVDKFAWATYREALRNVPDQSGFPWTIVWPMAVGQSSPPQP